MNDKLVKQLGSEHGNYPHRLEQEYPNIVEKIAEHWERRSLEAYLDGLLFDTRGNRAGFSPAILSEIFAVQSYYRSLQPAKPISIDTWGESASFEKKT